MSRERVYYKGKRLRLARLTAEIWTQKELAERTGIAPCIISDLERGARPLSPAWAMRIAEAVGMDYRELLDPDTGDER